VHGVVDADLLREREGRPPDPLDRDADVDAAGAPGDLDEEVALAAGDDEPAEGARLQRAQERDAGALEVGEVGDVVDVPAGVQVAVPDLDRDGRHGAVPSSGGAVAGPPRRAGIVGTPGRSRWTAAGYPRPVQPPLGPDRRCRAPLHGLCVVGGCSRRRSEVVTVRVGTGTRAVEVCAPHAERFRARTEPAG